MAPPFRLKGSPVRSGGSTSHYDEHLGETYVWMCGGIDAAIRAGREEIACYGIPAGPGDLVIDLGCGFGKHTIPLAAAGARVHAMDSSRAMLELLRTNLPPLANVRIRCGDIVEEVGRSLLRPDAIACLGDTLTHLAGPGAVERLLYACARLLVPGGRLALAFRDYSTWAPGETRSFEVRSGPDLRVDCAVTVLRDHVTVEDTICEQAGETWLTRSHRYRKLRLAPAAIEQYLGRVGLLVERLPQDAGMVRILARRP